MFKIDKKKMKSFFYLRTSIIGQMKMTSSREFKYETTIGDS